MERSTMMDLDEMTRAYVECALWSSTDMDTEESLDSLYGPEDLAPETLREMREDCESFAEQCSADLEGIDPGQAGHDFWLTRNGHGAGFWDRGLGERGDLLSDASKVYGQVDLYIGDDGMIYAA